MGSVNSKLRKAIDKGDVGLARMAIDKGADINIKDGRGASPLHLAIEGGHIDIVKLLIERGADININDGQGASPLHSTIDRGRIEIVKMLIERGADINIKDGRDASPLHSAIKGGHIEIVRMLIKKGADINIKDGQGASPLHLTIEEGHTDLAGELLERGADINVKDVRGASLLHSAIEGGRIDIVRMLINIRVDINIKDGQGASPLHSAIEGGRIDNDIVRMLIERGADINIKDGRDASPLHSAIKGSHIEIVRMLIEKDADINIVVEGVGSPLQWAIEGGHIDMAKKLLDRGADINVNEVRGASPLHLAIAGSYIDLASELIDRGADVNALQLDYSYSQVVMKSGRDDTTREPIDRGADINNKDLRVCSFLDLAIELGRIDTAREQERLPDSGADIKVQEVRGTSPLHLAIEGGHIDMAWGLIDKGADINIKDVRGDSPLHLVIMGGNINMAYRLINKGADINIKNDWGASPLHLLIWGGHTNHLAKRPIRGADANDLQDCSPLHVVIKSGRIDLARELIDKGADINIKNGQGSSPLHLAIELEQLDIARELINGGADLNVKDRCGQSPLYLVIMRHHNDLARVMIDRGRDSALHVSLIEGSMNNLQVLSKLETRITSELCSEGLLHTPVRLGYDKITKFLLLLKGIDVNATDSLGQSPLHCAMEIGNEDIISNLLDAGCKLDALDDSGRTVLHLSAIYGHRALTELFIARGLDPNLRDLQGKSCLHYGVIYRKDEIVELLCRPGTECEVKDREVKDHAGTVPKDYLHHCETNSAIFKELTKNPMETRLLPLGEESIHEINPSCYNLSKISKQPGIGSVNNIKGFVMADFINLVKEMVEEVIHEALLPNGAGVNVVGCGSSFEGSKVGMPDELDFLIEICSIYRNPVEETEGYGKMEQVEESSKHLNIQGTYGVWLWDKLMTYWKTNKNEDIGSGFRSALPPQRHPDRKTCTTWIWLYSNDMFKQHPVSIDFVPAIKIGCLSVERTTWMMTKAEIRKKHRHIVPKIPYETSNLAKSFQPEDLKQLGRISYPTLEVEHMQDLDERLMDVFITAKAIRQPEVCGFKIGNENEKAVAVGEHITSYRLKTVFLHLVELFLKSKTLSLGKMVLMVYEHLEKCLERERLPSFFDPSVDVLAGCRIDPKDSHVAAKIMTQLVRSMYEKDFQSAIAQDLEEEGMVLRVSRAEYDDREMLYKSDEHAFCRDYGALYIPIYLQD